MRGFFVLLMIVGTMWALMTPSTSKRELEEDDDKDLFDHPRNNRNVSEVEEAVRYEQDELVESVKPKGKE